MTSLRSFVLALLVALLAAVVLAEDAPKSEQARVDIASRSTLNDATALANKNTVSTDNNVAMLRSNAVMQQNDVLDMAQEASELPAGLTLMGEKEDLAKPDGVPHEYYYGYRRRFYYPYYRGGYYGWRYPIGYWNYYGPRYYGGYCPFGRYYGGYYYC